jgi:hypothetical protein
MSACTARNLTIKSSNFCDMTPSNPVERHRKSAYSLTLKMEEVHSSETSMKYLIYYC